ncbi:imine reductase family protein [Nocardia brasiliensis]
MFINPTGPFAPHVCAPFQNPGRGAGSALFHTAIDDDVRLARESGVDLSWHGPMHELLRRAVADGRGAQSITALIELLRTDQGHLTV